MATSPLRLRLATACALVLALAGTFPAPPALAQDTSGWQVVDTVSIDVDGFGFAPVLSPDGRWVAGLKDLDERQICVWKVSNGEERCNAESSRVADASIAWSPDSRQVAFSQNGAELDSDIFVLDVSSNSLTNFTEDDVDDLKAAETAGRFVIYDRWPVWSPDGAEIVFLRILNPRDEGAQRQISISRVILETGQVVRGQELMTGEPLEFVAETLGVVLPPVWLGKNSIAFAVRGGRDITSLYLAEVPAGELTTIESDPSIPVSNMPLLTGATADGDRLTLYWLWEDIAIGDEFYTYGALDLATGEITPIELDVPRGMTVAAPPRFTPDGTALVYGVTRDAQANSDSTVMIQDLETGETVEILDGVNLQFWESVQGIDMTAGNELVLLLDDGSFEVVALAQP